MERRISAAMTGKQGPADWLREVGGEVHRTAFREGALTIFHDRMRESAAEEGRALAESSKWSTRRYRLIEALARLPECHPRREKTESPPKAGLAWTEGSLPIPGYEDSCYPVAGWLPEKYHERNHPVLTYTPIGRLWHDKRLTIADKFTLLAAVHDATVQSVEKLDLCPLVYGISAEAKLTEAVTKALKKGHYYAYVVCGIRDGKLNDYEVEVRSFLADVRDDLGLPLQAMDTVWQNVKEFRARPEIEQHYLLRSSLFLYAQAYYAIIENVASCDVACVDVELNGAYLLMLQNIRTHLAMPELSTFQGGFEPVAENVFPSEDLHIGWEEFIGPPVMEFLARVQAYVAELGPVQLPEGGIVQSVLQSLKETTVKAVQLAVAYRKKAKKAFGIMLQQVKEKQPPGKSQSEPAEQGAEGGTDGLDVPDENGQVLNPKDKSTYKGIAEIIRDHWPMPPLPKVRRKDKELDKILAAYTEIYWWRPRKGRRSVHLGRWLAYVNGQKELVSRGLDAVRKEGCWSCRACRAIFANDPGSANCPNCCSDDITPFVPRPWK